MSFKTSTRSTYTVDVDGVEVELPLGPALDYMTTYVNRVGNKLIIGYLVQDDDCQNPLKDYDGQGTLYTSGEGVITDDESAVLRALGLTSLGSRPYPYERDLDHDGVFDLAKKLLLDCCCTPGGDDWDDFLAYCLDSYEREDEEQADSTFVEDVFDNQIDFGPCGDVLPGWLDARWTAMQEEAWDQLYERGKIGDYLAVPVRYCDNNHGPGTTSIDTCGIDDANAVWVPDDLAIQNIEASCYPNGVSVAWNSGDTVGNPQLAVVTFNGVRVYASTRWDDAHKFVRKHYGEPSIFDLQKAANKYAEGVLNEYQEWCNGNCFGYVVAVYTNVSTEDKPVWAMDEDYDSCWGFIGDEWAEEELARVVKYRVEKGSPMSEKKKVEVIIFDTGPETRDRYTAVFVNDPDYLERNPRKWPALAMDGRPFSPRGFGQHVEVSRAWVTEQLKVGRRVRMEDLPVGTIACILQDMKEYQELDYLD